MKTKLISFKVKQLEKSDFDAFVAFKGRFISIFQDPDFQEMFKGDFLRGYSPERKTAFVCFNSEQIVGEVLLKNYEDTMVGDMIQTDHDFFEQGIADLLLRKAEEFTVSLGITKFVVTVARGNRASINFTIKNGFKPVYNEYPRNIGFEKILK